MCVAQRGNEIPSEAVAGPGSVGAPRSAVAGVEGGQGWAEAARPRHLGFQLGLNAVNFKPVILRRSKGPHPEATRIPTGLREKEQEAAPGSLTEIHMGELEHTAECFRRPRNPAVQLLLGWSACNNIIGVFLGMAVLVLGDTRFPNSSDVPERDPCPGQHTASREEPEGTPRQAAISRLLSPPPSPHTHTHSCPWAKPFQPRGRSLPAPTGLYLCLRPDGSHHLARAVPARESSRVSGPQKPALCLACEQLLGLPGR